MLQHSVARFVGNGASPKGEEKASNDKDIDNKKKADDLENNVHAKVSFHMQKGDVRKERTQTSKTSTEVRKSEGKRSQPIVDKHQDHKISKAKAEGKVANIVKAAKVGSTKHSMQKKDALKNEIEEEVELLKSADEVRSKIPKVDTLPKHAMKTAAKHEQRKSKASKKK
jgi:hypothetical protein